MAYHLAGLAADEALRGLDNLARGFARAKVDKLNRNELNTAPLPGEIAYERRRLDTGAKVFGLLYDGVEIMRLLGECIPVEERRRDHIHLVFTNQLFGTWEDDDLRYHARVSVYGFPSLISTTGLVEAPAKPREFYLLKQRYTALGLDDAVDVGIKGALRGRILEHADQRLTEVLKGYILQALFYHALDEPFCPDPHCRLYNAHWQEEVLASQLGGSYELCPRHEGMLELIK